MTQEQRDEKPGRGARIALVLILIFVAVTLVNVVRARFARKAEAPHEETIPVSVVAARRILLNRVIDQSGDIHPGLEVSVYPKVGGKVIETLSVDKGDWVNKGDGMAELETGSIRARIEEGRAGLASAESDLNLAGKDLARIQNLFEQNAVSRQRLDVAEARQLSAKAQVDGIQAQLRQLRIVQEDHRITAPISGYVSARYLDSGALSDTGRPILRISSDRTVKIVTSVTENDFQNVSKGMSVEVRTDALPDTLFSGKISVINPTMDPATRTGEIEVHLANEDLKLRSGMFAHLRIYLGKKDGLAIPRDALKTDPGTGRYYVFIVKDGKAELRNLKLGQYQDNDVEVLEGVSAGEQVVIKGQNRLKHGYAVTVETGEGGAVPRENKEAGKGKV